MGPEIALADLGRIEHRRRREYRGVTSSLLDHPGLAFKRFDKKEKHDATPVPRLHRLIDHVTSLPAPQRRRMGSQTAMPRHLVFTGDELVGIVKAQIPDRFCVEPVRQRPRSLDLIMLPEFDPDLGRPPGVPPLVDLTALRKIAQPTRCQRLELALAFVDAIAFLRSADLLTSVCPHFWSWCIDGEFPSVFVFDCDYWFGPRQGLSREHVNQRESRFGLAVVRILLGWDALRLRNIQQLTEEDQVEPLMAMVDERFGASLSVCANDPEQWRHALTKALSRETALPTHQEKEIRP